MVLSLLAAIVGIVIGVGVVEIISMAQIIPEFNRHSHLSYSWKHF